MPQAEGGLPISRPIWSLAADPPLCHSVTSPPARGGEGNHEFFKGLFAGEMPKAEGGLPISRPIWSPWEDPLLSLRDISPRKGGRGES